MTRALSMSRADVKKLPVTLGPNSPLKGMRERRVDSNHREHFDQVEIFRWAREGEGGAEFPELRTQLVANRNAARTAKGDETRPHSGAWMKAEGVTKGVSDMSLYVAHGGYFGMLIEQKIEGTRPSQEQVEFIQRAKDQGYCTVFCFSVDDTKAALRWYMGLPRTLWGQLCASDTIRR